MSLGRPFNSNGDLAAFLHGLGTIASHSGRVRLAKELLDAPMWLAGSSSEFLGHAFDLLETAEREMSEDLHAETRSRIQDAREAIRGAFRAVGEDWTRD